MLMVIHLMSLIVSVLDKTRTNNLLKLVYFYLIINDYWSG